MTHKDLVDQIILKGLKRGDLVEIELTNGGVITGRLSSNEVEVVLMDEVEVDKGEIMFSSIGLLPPPPPPAKIELGEFNRFRYGNPDKDEYEFRAEEEEEEKKKFEEHTEFLRKRIAPPEKVTKVYAIDIKTIKRLRLKRAKDVDRDILK
jgi:hypothetical protein